MVVYRPKKKRNTIIAPPAISPPSHPTFGNPGCLAAGCGTPTSRARLLMQHNAARLNKQKRLQPRARLPSCLPRRKTRCPCLALYAFCRLVDDVADKIPFPQRQTARVSFRWRNYLQRASGIRQCPQSRTPRNLPPSSSVSNCPFAALR